MKIQKPVNEKVKEELKQKKIKSVGKEKRSE